MAADRVGVMEALRISTVPDDVIAAVAELVEAAKLALEMRWLGDDKPESSPVYRALIAALARMEPQS